MKKQKRRWVVDLGEEFTKITKGFCKETGRIEIENYWIEKTPRDIFKDGLPEKNIDLTVFLRTLLKEHQKNEELVLVLNHRKLQVASFTFPMMTLEEVKEAINWKMQVVVPEKFENWRIDFLAKERIEVFEYLGVDDKKLDVLGVAVEKKLLHAYCRVFNGIKHPLKKIEPQFHSLSKLFHENQKNSTLLIDLGQTSTRFYFYNNGFLQEERQIETRVSTDLEEYLTPVIKEILDNFQSPLGLTRKYENNNIYLLGGGSLEPGVLKYIKEKINKEIILLSTFLENQKRFDFQEELSEAERCLLMTCLSGMLE